MKGNGIFSQKATDTRARGKERERERRGENDRFNKVGQYQQQQKIISFIFEHCQKSTDQPFNQYRLFMSIELILACIGICLYSINFLICISMIILISLRFRPWKSNVVILLTCNTYFNAFLLNCMMLVMYFYNLLGNVHFPIVFDDRWCRIRAYLTHVCFCAFYHSFVLQATFRLFRIVFYRYQFLQSFALFFSSIVIQWILSFLFILPNFFFNDFQHLRREFNCWIELTNIRGLILATIFIYHNPLMMIFIIYIRIILYTRRVKHLQRQRQKSNRRDLIILKRIVLLGLITIGIGLPTIIVVLIYIITKFIIPFAYHIQGLSISLGVLIGSVSLIFINPQIQRVFRQNRIQERMLYEMTRPFEVKEIYRVRRSNMPVLLS